MSDVDTNVTSRNLVGTLVRYLAAQALVAVSTVVALWIAGRWGSAAVERRTSSFMVHMDNRGTESR